MKLTHEQEKLAGALTAKQLAFANLVLLQHENGLSDANCYREAGYSVKSDNAAAVNACKLLKNAKVSAYIDSLKLSSAEATGLTLEYLDEKLFNMLETSIDDLVDVVPITVEIDGREETVYRPVIKENLKDLPKEVLGSINSIKMTREGIQYSLPDKKAVLELAYKRKGGLVEKHEHTGKNGSPLVAHSPKDIEETAKKIDELFPGT